MTNLCHYLADILTHDKQYNKEQSKEETYYGGEAKYYFPKSRC